MRVGWFGFLCSLFIVAEKESYLCSTLALLSHKAKEDKEVTVLGLPQTIAIATEGLWSPLSKHSLVLSFARHDHLGAYVVSQNTLNYGQSKGNNVLKPTKHRKEPQNGKMSIDYSIKYTILPKNATKQP